MSFLKLIHSVHHLLESIFIIFTYIDIAVWNVNCIVNMIFQVLRNVDGVLII